MSSSRVLDHRIELVIYISPAIQMSSRDRETWISLSLRKRSTTVSRANLPDQISIDCRKGEKTVRFSEIPEPPGLELNKDAACSKR